MSIENFDKSNLVRVRLKKTASTVKEILTRLGIGDSKEKILYQSCHLVKINREWFIVHFKEVYGLIGGRVNWDSGDIQRRNKIARLLEDWEIIDILNGDEIQYSYDQFNSEENDIRVFRIKISQKEEYQLLQKVDIERFERSLLEKEEESYGNV